MLVCGLLVLGSCLRECCPPDSVGITMVILYRRDHHIHLQTREERSLKTTTDREGRHTVPVAELTKEF